MPAAMKKRCSTAWLHILNIQPVSKPGDLLKTILFLYLQITKDRYGNVSDRLNERSTDFQPFFIFIAS